MLPTRFLPFAALLGCFPLAASAADPAPPAAAAIRTPPAPSTPRINGPRVYGARPGHPFFYHLPVTGERPLKFAAQGLPAGLTLDPATGNVTGATTERGPHPVKFTVTNARGTDQATVNIVLGDTICLTPPMGWNSWNHFANRVTAADVRASGDAMVNSGLADHGWTYVNIDDCWQGERDAAGNIQGNAKFPDLKALGDYIHARGLKYGIYSSPGPRTCGGYNGSYGHEDQDARTYGGWGVDYVKYDRCSYSDISRDHLGERTLALFSPEQRSAYAELTRRREALRKVGDRDPAQDILLRTANNELRKLLAPLAGRLAGMTLEEEETPYRVFRDSLRKVPRDIVYSFCQAGIADVWNWSASLGGNCWRTTDDIQANWESMTKIGFSQDRLAKFAGPGHWNDPDMLEIGNGGLTPDECYTHMTLWCMLSAPLLIGCDLSRMDPFTVSLFSNDEVIAVDQDALGQQGYRLKAAGTTEVWVKPLANGDVAVALFNRGDQPAEIGFSRDELLAAKVFTGFAGSAEAATFLRDLWRQKTLPSHGGEEKFLVAAHGAELLCSGVLDPLSRDHSTDPPSLRDLK